MDGVEAGGAAAFPTDGAEEPHKKMAEERSAAEKSFMGFKVKVSKVAQVAWLPRQVRLGGVAEIQSFTTKDTKAREGNAYRSGSVVILRDKTLRVFRLICVHSTNFTKFTNWC